MANLNEIGIDLGTTKVMIYKAGEGIILNEPSVVAYDTDSGEPFAFGDAAFLMVGKTHRRITTEYPRSADSREETTISTSAARRKTA